MLLGCVRPRSSRVIELLAIGALVVGGVLQGVPPAVAGTHPAFPQPAYLRPRVAFWVKIFGEYSSRDFVIHDRDAVWKIYDILHLPGSGRPSAHEVAGVDNYLTSKYERILRWLARGKQPVSPAERRVAALFRNAGPAEYRAAADNLRVQQGLSDSFRRGILRSRRYCRSMERIFGSRDLPTRLVVLAAVESGFNPHARSSANAVGMWQFIRSTGRHYLRIDRYHDQRLDPLASTRAAARLLHSNYEQLGSWPLAITAYDYGIQGMMRASAANGGNYRLILKRWHGPYFGFAVKNYYSEFLAALRIYEHPSRYFPGIERTPLLMADAGGGEQGAAIESAAGLRRYRVRRGDTLSRVARRYGIEVASLERINRVRDARALRVGRLLAIPAAGSGNNAQNNRAYAANVSAARPVTRHYRVRRGDTLYRIARRYGIEPAMLAQINGVHDAHGLRVGRLLAIPAPGVHRYALSERRHYRVRPGDTLYEIAQRAGVEVKELMEANRVDDPRSLVAGSMLVIPAE